MSTAVESTTAIPTPVFTTNQFYINLNPYVQLEAFKSSSDVTVQVSFPQTGWPTLSTDLSSGSQTGEIDFPNFQVSLGGNLVNYMNLRVSFQANYNGSTPVNVLAFLLLDVSLGPQFNPAGDVGANYVLGF